jgi:hypothetical protein
MHSTIGLAGGARDRRRQAVDTYPIDRLLSGDEIGHG